MTRLVEYHIRGGGDRWDVFCAMPEHPKTILDVGCGEGNGFAIKRQQGSYVVGIDSDPAVLEHGHNLDELHILNVETDPLPSGSYEVIALLDVLEHMIDPWTVLRRLRPLLAEDGVIVASIPNLRQVRILIKLALGRWDYDRDSGTVSRPHIRFFTRRTIRTMFAEAGYRDVRFFFPRQTFHLRGAERMLNALTFGRLADLLYGSYTVAAR